MEWLEFLLDMDTAIIIFLFYEIRISRANRKAELDAIRDALRKLKEKIK